MLKVMNNNSYEATSNSLQKSSSIAGYKPTPTSSRPINRQHHLLTQNNSISMPSNNNKLSASTSSSTNITNDYDNYKPSPRSSYLNHHLTKLNHDNTSLTNRQILLNKSNTRLNDFNYNDGDRYNNNNNRKSISGYNEQIDDDLYEKNRHQYEKQLQLQQHQHQNQLPPTISPPSQQLNHHNNTNSVSNKVNRNYLLQMNKKFRQKISANISGTKFEIVKQALEAIGCKILSDDNFDCNLIWDDTRVSVEGISELKSFQRYNHFPAMSEISKKDALARNILKIYKQMPQDFDFVPKTWIMPNEYSNLVSYAFEMKKMQQKRTYIMKPANGAMGHGIKLYKNVEKIQPTENYVVQEYIPNPYLLDGFKFDLRIYALVTSCDPLRAFIYNNGLVRLGTEEYQEPNESNIDHLFMHLTNYSVNKKNKQFYDEGDTNGETGTKRSLKYLFEHLRRNNKDTSKLWKNIQDIILKTLLVAEPYLFHTYKMCRPGQIPGTESVCFEILGFDILIDEKMKPWVLEVNRSPSFGTNQQIDFDIKSKLLINSFELLHLRASDRQRSQVMEKAEAKRRLYNLSSFTHKMDTNGMNAFETSIPKSLLQTLSSNNSTSAAQLSKRFKTKERRKMELIDQIKLFRREQRRQELENRNLGNYSRLFPIDDKYDMEYYLNILSTAFNLFYPVGKQFQWKKTYERIKEDKLLNELAECDEDYYDQSNYEQVKKYNQYLKDDYLSTESEEEIKNDSDDEPNDHHSHHNHHHHNNHHNSDDENDYLPRSGNSRKVPINAVLDQEAIKSNRLSTLINAVSNTTINNLNYTDIKTRNSKSSHNLKLIESAVNKSTNNLINQIKQHQAKQINDKIGLASASTSNTASKDDNDENNANVSTNSLNIAVLKLLNQLEIKFPGKSSQQTKNILNKLYSRLEFYKPKIANYWMVKLDDAKRSKILNIVKSNLVVILQKVFQVDAVENLRLFKIFTKLINRMLWMHGQGLWNCFISKTNSSWESIFNKSTFTITDSELRCCYRVIELCKDSVLIVYQYAFEQKPSNEPSTTPTNSNTPTEQILSQRSSSHSLNRLRNPSISNNLSSLSKSKILK